MIAARVVVVLMVFDYIETFYNPIRLQSSLGLKSPTTFEKIIHLN